MRTRRTPAEQEAVARRLELLSAELTTVRGEGEALPVPHDPLSVAPLPVDPGSGGPVEDHTRVRLADEEAPIEDSPVPGPPSSPPPPLPHPGRHADRREGAGRVLGLLAALVPPTLRGRVGVGPGQLAVVAVAVAVGLAVTAWWVARADAEPRPVDVAPTPAAGLVEPAGEEAPAGEAGSEDGEVVVDVAGKVRDPGIATLPAGARVVDALDAAGGARKGVDLTGLNLARVLVDGEQVLVGVDPAPVGSGAPSGAPRGGPAGAPVRLNTADQAALEELPGVGPVTAGAILDWRAEHGHFSSVEELLEVDGIGEATLEDLRELVAP